MKLKLMIPALAACMAMSGAAMADDGPGKKKGKKHQQQSQSQNSTAAGGVAVAGPRGAGAGGVGIATSSRRGTGQMSAPNSATTSTTGAVYTDRRRGSAAINTNGAAQGDGTVRSSSEGEVFSSTTRDGSQADAYGNSEAEAQERRRQRPR